VSVPALLSFAGPLPEPLLVLNRDGLVVEANPAARRCLGRDPVGSPLSELTEDTPEELQRFLRACAGSGQLVLGSLSIITADGAVNSMRAEGAALTVADADGNRLLLVRLAPRQAVVREFELLNQRIDALATEIHRRRLAEAALRSEEERMRVTLASIGDAVMATDGEGRVTYSNSVAETLTGWRLEEARGRPLQEIFHIIQEAGGQPGEDIVAEVLQKGVVVGLANHTVLIARDGTRRPIADSAAPIRGDNGSIEGVVLVFHDVTENRLAERRVRESEERYRALVDATAAIVWRTDADGVVREQQESWTSYTGQSAQEQLEMGWLAAIHPDDRPRIVEEWLSAAPVADSFHSEGRVWHAPTGAYRRFEVRGVALRDGDGRLREWVGMYMDVEDRKRAEDALRDADRRKDEFLATLAHELRNPLSPILNSLSILAMARGDAAVADRAMGVMERQLGHMVRLVDDLLDASRISRGKIELRLEDVELASVLRHAVESVRNQLDARRQELLVQLPPQPVHVRADPVRLAQVLVNLLANASKFSEAGAQIELIATTEGDHAVVDVRDQGVGIAPEHADTVFEMFTQLDQSLERTQTGLGIGLPLARRLTEMHGGRLELHSEGPGTGSTFTVRLPLSVDGAAIPATATTDRGSTGARRVLVADDNVDSAETLATILRMLGHEPFVTHDGEAAVQRAAEVQPDVILLDIGMPKLNGYEACRRIRSQPWASGICIVALTGWGQDDARNRTREAGFDAHLVKPVSLDELERAIASHPGVTTAR